MPVVDSTPLVWLLRALYYLLPNLAPFDVTAQVVHGQPVPAGYLLMTIGYAAIYVTVLLSAASFIFSQAGLQVTARRGSAAARVRADDGGAGCAAFVAVEAWRDRVYGEPTPGDSVLYIRSGEALRRMSLSFTPLARRRLLDPRRAALRQHAAEGPSSRNYELLYPLLDITTTLDPRFVIAYRFGSIFLAEALPGRARAPRPGDRAAREGVPGGPDPLALPAGHRVRPLLVAGRLPHGRDVVPEGRRHPGRALVVAVAGGGDARSGRRSP